MQSFRQMQIEFLFSQSVINGVLFLRKIFVVFAIFFVLAILQNSNECVCANAYVLVDVRIGFPVHTQSSQMMEKKAIIRRRIAVASSIFLCLRCSLPSLSKHLGSERLDLFSNCISINQIAHICIVKRKAVYFVLVLAG